MEKESVSACDVRGPSVRLWLTVALGILGVWLFPGAMEFFPNPFAAVKSGAMGGWMVFALLGVLLLRHIEKMTSPKRVTGVESGMRSRLRRLLRHMSATLVAPYFLYASRPASSGGASSLVATFTRAAFAVFPFMFAAGVATWLAQYRFRKMFLLLASRVGLGHFISWLFEHGFSQMWLLWFSLSIWTWLGCALLFFLSPPAEYPRTPKIRRILETGRPGLVLTAVLIAMASTLLILSSPGRFLGIILVALLFLFFTAFTWLTCPLLLLLSSAANYPCMANQPEALKANPIRMAVAMAVALVPLASRGFYPFLAVVTGSAFGRGFSHANAGFALDQPTIGKFFLWNTVFSVTMFVLVSVARGMSDRRSRLGYWAFAVPTSIIGVLLLSMLTDAFCLLIAYIRDMGFTPTRIYGLAFGIGSYSAVLGFLWWALWPPKRKEMTS